MFHCVQLCRVSRLWRYHHQQQPPPPPSPSPSPPSHPPSLPHTLTNPPSLTKCLATPSPPPKIVSHMTYTTDDMTYTTGHMTTQRSHDFLRTFLLFKSFSSHSIIIPTWSHVILVKSHVTNITSHVTSLSLSLYRSVHIRWNNLRVGRCSLPAAPLPHLLSHSLLRRTQET